uniref:Uncharacterized protein n=1 Tax=Junco hyemalis TaxID=40217 RepID=A0A8C5JGY8_JUNHY
MTLWNGSYPFYPGANACFPFDTTRAVIVTVFLSMLATFIIILPGIPGRRVSGGAGALQTSAPCLCIPHSSSSQPPEHIWQAKLPGAMARSPCGVHGQYRIAGHYVSLTLWLAFCTWLISILLFSMSILLYGGQMLLLTGTLILSSLLLFSTARSSLRCPFQFGPVSLRTDYGESFWLALATGLLCLLLGLAIIILNCVQPQKLKLIFSLDRSSEEEQWEQPWLPAQPSCSAQGGFMVPLGELCPGTATRL